MSLFELFTSFPSNFKRSQHSTYQLPLTALLAAAFALSTTTISGCVMSEEMKRIDAVKKLQQARDESGSTNLTGEQIFIRNCNTCHPGGRAGMGPSLENFAKDYPTDDKLKAFLRKGKGMMPSQERLSEQEMDNLVTYLHALTFEK
jgi:mono/diheme cytochrome c family protein